MADCKEALSQCGDKGRRPFTLDPSAEPQSEHSNGHRMLPKRFVAHMHAQTSAEGASVL